MCQILTTDCAKIPWYYRNYDLKLGDLYFAEKVILIAEVNRFNRPQWLDMMLCI